ncbi:alpha/beta hydrolase family protein [Ideonella sp.]|uniref:alpha/beta hydrolase family protein n=1 Tax=Ideonella sp. TaxID=1929293 RepID=UPI0035B11A41
MRPAAPHDVDLKRRTLLALAAAPAFAWPAWATAGERPEAAGALNEIDAAAQVPAIDWEWVDTARQRQVPVRLYWPQRPPSATGSPVPLVVFSHGIGGSRQGYSYLGRHLASRGWACLHVQHVGSDRALWFGNPFSLVDRLRSAAQESEAIHRVQDLRFALDRLLDPALQHPLVGRVAEAVDAQRIVAAGHSYGANTTLLAVGARVARGERVYDFHDPRFRAAILLSVPPFYGERDLAGILAPVKLPTLHITSNDDVILIPGYRSGVEDRLAIYDAVPDARKALVVFGHGSHSIFTDRTVSGGYELNQQVKGATKALAAAFLRHQFEQDGAALPRWSEHWQGIVARSAGLGAAVAPTAPPPAAGVNGLAPAA